MLLCPHAFLLFYSFTFLLLIVSLHVCNLLLQFAHLLFLKYTFVLDRNNLYEVLHVSVPVVEHSACKFGASI